MGLRKDLLATEEIAEFFGFLDGCLPLNSDESDVWTSQRERCGGGGMAISKDTAAEQEGKKVVHKFQRWIRLSANDRSVPASDQQ